MAKKVNPIVEKIRERTRLGLPFDPYAFGNVVMEFKVGNTKCYICDDFCRDKTPEEVQQILKNCGKIRAESLMRQAAEKAKAEAATQT